MDKQTEQILDDILYDIKIGDLEVRSLIDLHKVFFYEARAHHTSGEYVFTLNNKNSRIYQIACENSITVTFKLDIMEDDLYKVLEEGYNKINNKIENILKNSKQFFNDIGDCHKYVFDTIQQLYGVRGLAEKPTIIFIGDSDKICYRKIYSIHEDVMCVDNKYGFKKDFKDIAIYTGNIEELETNISRFFFNQKSDITTTTKEGSNKMNEGLISKMIEVNKQSAVNSAKLEVGKTANKIVLDKVKPMLPMIVRGYADSPLSELVIGNIVAGLLMQFAPGNKKAEILSEAMIAAGAQVAIEAFDVTKLVQDLLKAVEIPVEE